MYSNYELNKQYSNQRLQARYQDAAQHRLAKKENPTRRRVIIPHLNLRHLAASTMRYLRHPGTTNRPVIQEG